MTTYAHARFLLCPFWARSGVSEEAEGITRRVIVRVEIREVFRVQGLGTRFRDPETQGEQAEDTEREVVAFLVDVSLEGIGMGLARDEPWKSLQASPNVPLSNPGEADRRSPGAESRISEGCTFPSYLELRWGRGLRDSRG